MPFWKIYHSDNTLSSEDKAAIAKAVTNHYVSVGLPASYVNIFYLPLSPSNFYAGGKPESLKVTVEIVHIARNWDSTNTSAAVRMKNSFDSILKPYTLDKGVDLEFSISDAPAALWRINGIDPPEGSVKGQHEQAEISRKLLEQSFATA